jgi:predicted CoA-binding protein
VTPLTPAGRVAHPRPAPGPDEGPVAIIGASADRGKFGNRAVRAYAEAGYTVWPVNPKDGEVEGVRTFASVDDLPDLPNIASIYLREPAALATLDALAEMERVSGRQIGAVYVNPGVATTAVRRRAALLGLAVRTECSIRAIGRDPEEFAPGSSTSSVPSEPAP